MKIACIPALLVLGAALTVPHDVAAAPFTPRDDAAVLETLPGKPGDPAAAELRRLRAADASRHAASRIEKRIAEKEKAGTRPALARY